MRLGLGLARVVAEVHRHGVVHKDINPANVVVGAAALDVWLIDFDLASVFAEERLAFSHVSELSGTLPYMAPEQTGRTGRVLDARADLYSLGATLYAAATGRPPFEGEDPLKLVHCHLTRAPLAPETVDARVPRNLSRIIMQLLEKEPDARYQSADGLLFDLGKAYEAWLAVDPGEIALGRTRFPGAPAAALAAARSRRRTGHAAPAIRCRGAWRLRDGAGQRRARRRQERADRRRARLGDARRRPVRGRQIRRAAAGRRG